MKPCRNWLTACLLAASALVTAGAAAVEAADTASPHSAHYGHHHGPWKLLRQLGLSETQQSQIKALLSNARPQMQSLHQQMRTNSLKLEQTQPTDPNYASIVSDVSQAHGSLAAQLVTQHAEVRAQIFKILTPTQQAQYMTLEAQMQAQRQAAWGGHT